MSIENEKSEQKEIELKLLELEPKPLTIVSQNANYKHAMFIPVSNTRFEEAKNNLVS